TIDVHSCSACGCFCKARAQRRTRPLTPLATASAMSDTERSGTRPNVNFVKLVIVEREAILQAAMLIVRVFVGPHRVPQDLAAHLQVEIVGSALERALRRGCRALELVHL